MCRLYFFIIVISNRLCSFPSTFSLTSISSKFEFQGKTSSNFLCQLDSLFFEDMEEEDEHASSLEHSSRELQ